MSLFQRMLKRLNLLPPSVHDLAGRMDLQEIPICENLLFLVYWKTLNIGKGPAVVLQAFDTEILKFDCFGEDRGHYHIAPNYHFRIYFLEKTVTAQIQRTVGELHVHGLRYLGLQKEARIRALRPSLTQYHSAIDSVEKLLTHFHQTVKELQ